VSVIAGPGAGFLLEDQHWKSGLNKPVAAGALTLVVIVEVSQDVFVVHAKLK